MPWLKLITSFIPKAVWKWLGIALLAFGAVYFIRDSGYEAGVKDTQLGYEKASRTSLESDLSEIRASLHSALSNAEKREQEALRLKQELSNIHESSKEIKDEIDRLRRQDIDCTNIPEPYNKLFRDITGQGQQ